MGGYDLNIQILKQNSYYIAITIMKQSLPR